MFTFRAPWGLASRWRFDSWLCTPHWIDSRCPVACHSVQFSEFPQVADCRLQDCLTRRSVKEVVSENTRWQTGEPADAVSTLKGKTVWSVLAFCRCHLVWEHEQQPLKCLSELSRHLKATRSPWSLSLQPVCSYQPHCTFFFFFFSNMDESIITLHAVPMVDFIYYSDIKHWTCTRSVHAELSRLLSRLLLPVCADAFPPLQCLLLPSMCSFPPNPANLGGCSF